MESEVKVRVLAVSANAMALAALGAALWWSVGDRPAVVLDAGAVAITRVELAERALQGLEQRLTRLEEALRAAPASVSDEESSRQTIETSRRWRALEERLAQLESMTAGGEAVASGIRAEQAAATMRAAAERYRGIFLDRSNAARMRGEAIEAMSRFPDTQAAVDDAVVQELRAIVGDPSPDPILVTKVVNVVRTRDWEGSTEILLSAARREELPRSARTSAVVGLQRRLAQPGVREALAALRFATADERIRQAVERSLSGRMERSGK